MAVEFWQRCWPIFFCIDNKQCDKSSTSSPLFFTAVEPDKYVAIISNFSLTSQMKLWSHWNLSKLWFASGFYRTGAVVSTGSSAVASLFQPWNGHCALLNLMSSNLIVHDPNSLLALTSNSQATHRQLTVWYTTWKNEWILDPQTPCVSHKYYLCVLCVCHNNTPFVCATPGLWNTTFLLLAWRSVRGRSLMLLSRCRIHCSSCQNINHALIRRTSIGAPPDTTLRTSFPQRKLPQIANG